MKPEDQAVFEALYRSHSSFFEKRGLVVSFADYMAGFEAACAHRDAQPAVAVNKPPLTGRWHHGNGVIVSGSIRIAQWDCDTCPPKEFRDEVLDWICETLNDAIASITHGVKVSSAVSVNEQMLEVIETVANNLGEFAGQMETQQKADQITAYASELFAAAESAKGAV
jgi:hypothetical protein